MRLWTWLRARFERWLLGERWTHEELQARIAADTADRDVDRFLPPSLRRYPDP